MRTKIIIVLAVMVVLLAYVARSNRNLINIQATQIYNNGVEVRRQLENNVKAIRDDIEVEGGGKSAPTSSQELKDSEKRLEEFNKYLDAFREKTKK